MRKLAIERLETREMLSVAGMEMTRSSELFLGERWGISLQEWTQAEYQPNLLATGAWWLRFEDRRLSLCSTEAISIQQHYDWPMLWPA